MMGRQYRDIVVRGVSYPSVRACAEALGVSAWTVYAALRRGAGDGIGRGRGHRTRMPVRVRGVVYTDADAAAKALGVSTSAVTLALARGSIDRVGLPRRAREDRSVYASRSRPVVIGGARFPSMAAASRALGFHDGYVSGVLGRGSARQRERLVGAAMAWMARQGRAA